MRDLATELREYVDRFDEPFDPDALIDKGFQRQASPVRSVPSFRRGVLVGLAAAVVILVLAGGALLLSNTLGGNEAPVVNKPIPETTTPSPTSPSTTAPSANEAPTTTQPATTTSSTAIIATTAPVVPYPVTTAEEDVTALYSAFNAGDWQAYKTLMYPPDGRSWSETGWSRLVDIAMNGAEMIIAYECDPGVTTESGTVEIRCSEQIAEDLFYTPAGVTWSNSLEYEVSPDGITLYSPPCEDPYCAPYEAYSSWSMPIWLTEPVGEAREYLLAFDEWLLDIYPDGHGISGWIWLDPDGPLPNWVDGHPCCAYSVENAVSGRHIFALVPEFIAQSDRWPIDQ